MCLISISLQLICNLLQLLFSIFSASSSIFFIFSVLLLLLEHVKLDNNFCYQVLVEVCMFLIIFIFIILPMLVWITYFCRNFRKKFSIFLNSNWLLVAIFLRFAFNQKEKRDFIWPKTLDLLFQKDSIFYSEKRGVPLK